MHEAYLMHLLLASSPYSRKTLKYI